MSCVESHSSHSSLHSIHSIHSPFNSAHKGSGLIQEALEAARAMDRAMHAVRKPRSPSSPSEAAGGAAAAPAETTAPISAHTSSPAALIAPSTTTSSLLKKFARVEACGAVGIENPPSPKSDANSYSGDALADMPHSWNPGAVGAPGFSMAFTKFLHMQHKYQNCEDITSDRLIPRAEDAASGSKVTSMYEIEVTEPCTKRLREEMDRDETLTHTKRLREDKESWEALNNACKEVDDVGSPSSGSVSKGSQKDRVTPCASPLHSVSAVTLDDLGATGSTR